jgi:hypothetical protein
MKQIEFNLLTAAAKLETLWKFGFLIGSRKDKKYAYMFYCLHKFFVEVKYEAAIMIETKTFKSSKQLSFYPVNHPFHYNAF